MRTIVLNKKKIGLKENFNKSLFENIFWSWKNFQNHHNITADLVDKNPYTITVIIETLNFGLRNKKEYVKKTKVPIISKYRELLYDKFFEQYGEWEGNRIFGEWLKRYRPIWQKDKKYESVDEFIIANEFEPRYGKKILARFKNHNNLFKERFIIERNRYYNLSKPLDEIDYRNPYDNIFIWHENGKKSARRGGSGASSSRETNSKFIYGFLELSQKQPIPSYLFIYSGENKLLFVKKLNRLCVPAYDIGYNYRLDSDKAEKLERNGTFLRWDDFSRVKEIEMQSHY